MRGLIRQVAVVASAVALSLAARASGDEVDASAGAGLAARFVGDVGLQSHPSVIMADNFESWPADGLDPPPKTWHGIYKNKTCLTHVIDGEVKLPGGAVPGRRVLAIKNWHGGNGRHVGGVRRRLGNYSRKSEGLGDGYEEVYVRFYLKFAENYKGVGNHGTNLGGRDLEHPNARWAGMSNTRDVASQGYFFTGLQPYGGIGKKRGMQFGFYSYHMDKPNQWGDHYGLKSEPLEVGRWYCVERRLKLNTVEPLTADGVEQLWIDGVPQITKEGLRFTRSKTLRITFFSLENYYERLDPEWTPENPVTVLYDNVVVAREYIGPAAISKPEAPKRTANVVRKARPLDAFADDLAPIRRAAKDGDFEGAITACTELLVANMEAEGFGALRAFAEGLAAGAQLKERVIARAAGAKPMVYIETGAGPQRVKLVAADAKGVRVEVGGNAMPIAWRGVSPRRFYGIAAKLVDDSGASHLALARYCATMGLRAEAREELSRLGADLAEEAGGVRALVE